MSPRPARLAGVWREVARYLHDHYIDPAAPLLDLGCDRGHFVRASTATERWATDIRDVSAHLPPDVRFVQASGLDLAECLPNGYFGTVFMSNYLEHLHSSDASSSSFASSPSSCAPAAASSSSSPTSGWWGRATGTSSITGWP